MEGWKAFKSIKLYRYFKKLTIVNVGQFVLELDPLFFAAIAIMYFCGYLVKYIIIFASIVVHELAHSIVAFILGRHVYGIKVMPVGLCVSIEEIPFSRLENMFIYFSGPFINLFLCLLFKITGIDSAFCDIIVVINAYLALFNIMPLLPLDGGKILLGILVQRAGLFAAYRYVRRTSIFVGMFFIILGVIQLINSTFNFSLLAIGIYLFFYIFTENMEAALMNIKDIIYRRSRMVKKGIYPARDLVVIKRMQLGDVIKHMDFDRFHLIYVLDDDLKVIEVFTEQQIMDGIMNYKSSITFDEFIKLTFC